MDKILDHKKHLGSWIGITSFNSISTHPDGLLARGPNGWSVDPMSS